MRITDPGSSPLRSAPTNPPTSAIPSRSPEALPLPTQPSAPQSVLADRLTALLGASIPASEIETLAVALSAAGYGPEVGRDVVLRALLLQRNTVPLSPALLDSPLPEQIILLPEAARLRDAAFTLLNKLPPAESGPIKLLAESLDALLDSGTSLPGASGIASDPELLARTIRRSGLAFEWRLLSWYRKGRDPAMLGALVRGDLKGVLLRFLAELESLRTRGAAADTGGIEKDARSLLDHITGRQIDHLPESGAERRTLFLEVPFGRPEERMYAGVRARRDGPEAESAREGGFTLALDIETTRLGPVRANLRFMGKTVAATFLLRNHSTLTLAESMADEFREMLRNRGYSPGSVRFALAEEPDGYAEADIPPRRRLDRRG